MGPRHPSASHWKLATWITYGPSSKECSASKGCTASHPTPTPPATLRFVCRWCVHPPPKNWSNHRCRPLRQNCVKTAEVVPLFISILLYIISIYCTWYRCISLFLFSFTLWFYGPCFTRLLAAALQRMGLCVFLLRLPVASFIDKIILVMDQPVEAHESPWLWVFFPACIMHLPFGAQMCVSVIHDVWLSRSSAHEESMDNSWMRPYTWTHG